MRIEGVYNILTTPFGDDGSLDEASLARLVESILGLGVDGLTILGVAGEAQKLAEAERARVIALVMETVAGRVPVCVGTSADGTGVAAAASVAAEAAGAAAVMVAPPTFLQAGAGLTAHYRAVAEAIGVPVILQDFPPVNGVTLSPRQMADLVAAVPSITCVKLEGVPTPPRVGDLRSLVDERVTIVGGLGGMYLLDELRRGASGTMTGFAFPEALVEIWRAWRAGDRAGAAEAYRRWLPLLVFEGQTGVGLAVRKELLRRRGFIASAQVRRPGTELDPRLAEDLSETLAQLDLRDLASRR
ncbi:MAG TPA: dihydrodipicolinate synthase family protein [Candidatus Dormibacteraeota bacterium]